MDHTGEDFTCPICSDQHDGCSSGVDCNVASLTAILHLFKSYQLLFKKGLFSGEVIHW